MCACLIIISSIHFPWCIIYMFSLFPATVQFTSGYIKIYQDISRYISTYFKISKVTSPNFCGNLSGKIPGTLAARSLLWIVQLESQGPQCFGTLPWWWNVAGWEIPTKIWSFAGKTIGIHAGFFYSQCLEDILVIMFLSFWWPFGHENVLSMSCVCHVVSSRDVHASSWPWLECGEANNNTYHLGMISYQPMVISGTEHDSSGIV